MSAVAARAMPSQRRAMFLSSRGNIASFVLASMTPFYARFALGASTFAMWALLNTVATVATTLDFGGATLIGARLRVWSARATFWRAFLLTVGGSLLVGGVAMLLWSLLVALGKAPAATAAGYGAFALVSGGAIARSVVNLDATIAVVAERFDVQTKIYVSQAVFQVVLVVGLITGGFGYWALPCAMLLSSLFVVIAMTRWRWSQLRTLDTVAPASAEPLRSFAAARTLGGALLLAVTQGDRWAVGAVATNGLLADYDLAARAAAIPRFIAAAMGGVVIPQHVLRGDSLAKLRTLYRSAQRVSVSVSGLFGFAILVSAAFVFGLGRLSSTQLALIAVLLVGNLANAGTVIGAMFVNARLRASAELPYLTLAGAVFAALVAVAAFRHSAAMAAAAGPLGLAVGSVYFLIRHPWFNRQELRSVANCAAVPAIATKSPDEEVGVVYVVGAMRSGTTLFAQALGQHPDVFSMGEVINLWRAYLRNSPCSCGAPLPQCDFWGGVFDEFRQTFGVSAIAEAEAARARAFRLRQLRYGVAGGSIGSTPQLSAYVDYYRGLTSIVARRTGARWLVDTSKTPVGVPFAESVGFDFRFIYMVRDPRGVACSEKREGSWPGVQTQDKPPVRRVASSALVWASIDLFTRKLIASQPDIAGTSLKYEEFVAAPEESLANVARWMGLSSYAWPRRGDAIRVEVGHTGAGNPARHNGGWVEIAERREWLSALPVRDRRTVEALTFVGRKRYGYR